MQYAHDVRSFVFSHYAYRGVRTAAGVIGLAMLAMNFTDMRTAMVVSIGALCTAQMDLPSPLRHKFNEMLASTLLCTAVTLVVSLASGIPWLLPILLVAISFFSGMLTVYGNKTMPLQFSMLFIMALTLMGDFAFRNALTHALLFAAGGFLYMAYALAVSWLLRRRTKEQILAECLFEQAQYLEIKAGFYDMSVDFDAQFNQLVRQQIVLAERQQMARDLVLRDVRTAEDRRLLQIHLRMLDVYEYILSTNTDYQTLRKEFAGTDILDFLGRMVHRLQEDMEDVAYAVTRNRASYATTDYAADIRAIETELSELGHSPHGISQTAMTALSDTFEMIRGAVVLIGQLHAATRAEADAGAGMSIGEMTAFVTRQKYEWRSIVQNLTWRSPVFRFAVRIALAVAAGLVVIDRLPYAAHGYWILVTIVVILKPTFSMTKQRWVDRVIGTVVGCIVAVLILRFIHDPRVLLVLLFISMAAGVAFVTIKYRYTVMATCIQILLQFNLLMPDSKALVSERIIDTLAGALIASIFSFVLPNWEYRNLPRLVENVLDTNRRYIRATRDLLLGVSPSDFLYRIHRKQFMDSLSALISAFGRMLDEPKGRQRAVDNLNRFIVQNYLVAAHVAAVRILLLQRIHQLDPVTARQGVETATNAAYDSLCLASERLHEGNVPEQTGVGVQIEQVEQRIDTREHVADSADRAAILGLPDAVADEAAHPDAAHLLDRRLRALRADAAKIALRTGGIGRAMRKRDD
jgi:uncharacterized membrane protein YccC